MRARWRLKPKLAVGDAKYGTVPNIVGLEKRGIKAYLPTSDFSQRNKYYHAKLFRYDAKKDRFICPQGQTLPFRNRRMTEQVIVYRANPKICNACPVKSECTSSKSGRFMMRWSQCVGCPMSSKYRLETRKRYPLAKCCCIPPLSMINPKPIAGSAAGRQIATFPISRGADTDDLHVGSRIIIP